MRARIAKYSLAVMALGAMVGAYSSDAAAQQPVRPQAGPATVTADDAQDVDERLEDRVAYRLETDDALGKYNVNVEVDEGVATLSGEVATEAQRAAAVRVADDVEGIARIENEIDVDPDADRTLADRASRGLSKTGDAIDDAWITTKVNWFFMGEDALEGSDINVDTEDNVVTLKGTVRSEAGRARAKALAQRTEGVKSVRDELVVAAPR